MSNPIQAINPVHALVQTQLAAPAPKIQPTATATAVPQDKVTISPQAQKALAANPKPIAA
jgi:hypothetical protein